MHLPKPELQAPATALAAGARPTYGNDVQQPTPELEVPAAVPTAGAGPTYGNDDNTNPRCRRHDRHLLEACRQGP